MVLEEGDLVLCTVDRVIGTAVFVKIEGDGEGSIIFSEVAPGRIRNIRDYVVPKKKVVCKVLRVSGDRIDLSLRRVTQKEQKEVLEFYKQEQSLKNIFKGILGSESESVIEKITKKESLADFCQKIKINHVDLEKIIGKESAKKILDILQSQKKKNIIIKKEFSLVSRESDGIEKIKKILSSIKELEIKYISAGRYTIKATSEDIKKADNLVRETLENIEKQAKKQNMTFSIKEK